MREELEIDDPVAAEQATAFADEPLKAAIARATGKQGDMTEMVDSAASINF